MCAMCAEVAEMVGAVRRPRCGSGDRGGGGEGCGGGDGMAVKKFSSLPTSLRATSKTGHVSACTTYIYRIRVSRCGP
jgi:hypothetical protein